MTHWSEYTPGVLRRQGWRAVLVIAAIAWIAPPATRAQTTGDFFDDGIMQDIWLEMNPADWATLQANYLANTYYPARFTWNTITLDIGIRSRGSGSRSPLKPNFLFKFDRTVKGQTFLGEIAIVAKANNQDASNLREHLAFKMFQRMGLPAPRESFARIHLNGEILGLYALVEYIDEQLLSRVFGENTGYLYEWTADEPYNFEDLGPDPAAYAKFLDLKTSQSAPDLNNFAAFVTAVNHASDAEFATAVSRFLDVKLYLTYVAIENAVVETDGILSSVYGMNNTYLYQFAKDTKIQFLPWDKDMSFDWEGLDILSGTDKNVLTKRLLAIPEYRNTYMSALARAAELLGGPGGWAERELAREYEMIAPDARTEPHKQCGIGGIIQPCGAAEFEAAVEHIRAFLQLRKDFVVNSVGGVVADPLAPRISNVTMRGSESPYVATGALATLAGTGLGAAGTAPAGSTVPPTIGSVWLTVDGARAPLLSVSGTEIQFQVPWGMLPGRSFVAVQSGGVLSSSREVELISALPLVLAVTHVDGSLVSASRPAARGETITAWALGLGAVNREMVNGALTPATPLINTRHTPSISVGGIPAAVSFSGLTPGGFGLYQVNFAVPENAASGGTGQAVVTQAEVRTSFALPIQ